MGARKRSSSLQEKLNLSNDELKSGWMVLGSLIYYFEEINWSRAQEKAKELFRMAQVDQYIQFVRSNCQTNFNTENFRNSQSWDEQETKLESGTTLKLFPNLEQEPKRNKYQKNFERLLQIAPDLEKLFYSHQLFTHQKLKGISIVTGYRTIHFDGVKIKGDTLIFTLSILGLRKFKIRQQMTLLIDFKKRHLEALRFQKGRVFDNVYLELEQRKWLNPENKKQQNDFLKDWLKELSKQRHCIEWNEVIEWSVEDEQESRNFQEDKFNLEAQQEQERLAQEEADRIEQEQQEQLELEAKILEEQLLKQADKLKEQQEFGQMIRDIAQEIEWSVEEVTKHVHKDLDYSDNFDRVANVQYHQKLSGSFDALGTENFRLLNQLIPNLQERLKYRHSKGEFKTPQGNWEIVWAKTRSSEILQFVISKSSKTQESQNPPALVSLTFVNSKAWIASNDKGFYGLQAFTENGDEKAQSYRLEANYEFFKLLKGFEDEDCSFQWLNDPSESYIEPFEIGSVFLTQAHKIEGIEQKHIDWINTNQTGMRIDFDNPQDKSSLTHAQAIWNQSNKPPVQLEANGQIKPYEYNFVPK